MLACEDERYEGQQKQELGIRKGRLLIVAYLDTCIVSGLAKDDLDEQQLAALRMIAKDYEEHRVALFASELVAREISRVSPGARARHEEVYNSLLKVPLVKMITVDPGMMMTGVGGGRTEPWKLRQLKQLMPGTFDAEHIFQAASNSIPYFITVDFRTILRHTDRIFELSQVRALSPVDFIEAQSQQG